MLPFGAAVVVAVGGLWGVDRIFGLSLAGQMARHVLVLSVVAPCVAIGLVRAFRLGGTGVASPLVIAVASQVAVLYFWHLPAAHAAAMHQAWGSALMFATLVVAGVGFWLVIAASLTSRRWQAVAALLATGKLFCLLGVLLVFARRPLYAATGLADQQLAGLVMLGACPVVYVAAAFVITCRGIPGAPPDYGARSNEDTA